MITSTGFTSTSSSTSSSTSNSSSTKKSGKPKKKKNKKKLISSLQLATLTTLSKPTKSKSTSPTRITLTHPSLVVSTESLHTTSSSSLHSHPSSSPLPPPPSCPSSSSASIHHPPLIPKVSLHFSQPLSTHSSFPNISSPLSQPLSSSSSSSSLSQSTPTSLPLSSLLLVSPTTPPISSNATVTVTSSSAPSPSSSASSSPIFIQDRNASNPKSEFSFLRLVTSKFQFIFCRPFVQKTWSHLKEKLTKKPSSSSPFSSPSPNTSPKPTNAFSSNNHSTQSDGHTKDFKNGMTPYSILSPTPIPMPSFPSTSSTTTATTTATSSSLASLSPPSSSSSSPSLCFISSSSPSPSPSSLISSNPVLALEKPFDSRSHSFSSSSFSSMSLRHYPDSSSRSSSTSSLKSISSTTSLKRIKKKSKASLKSFSCLLSSHSNKIQYYKLSKQELLSKLNQFLPLPPSTSISSHPPPPSLSNLSPSILPSLSKPFIEPRFHSCPTLIPSPYSHISPPPPPSFLSTLLPFPTSSISFPTLNLYTKLRNEEEKLEKKINQLCVSPPFIVPTLQYPSFPPNVPSTLTWIYSQPHITIEPISFTLTRQDLLLLQGSHWLNDELINGFGSLLQFYFPKVAFFNSFFYLTLTSEHQHHQQKQPNQSSFVSLSSSRLLRWSQRHLKLKQGMFTPNIDWLIFPIHLTNHWCTGAIDFLNFKIYYFDSLHGSPGQFFNYIHAYLFAEAEKRNVSLNWSEWKQVYEAVNLPQQRNGYDCGVFTCAFMEHCARGWPFFFTQTHMKYWRQKLAYELGTGKLLLS